MPTHRTFIATYIMASGRNGTTYVGMTANLYAGVWKHKTGVFEGHTKQYGCDRLVWFEAHASRPLSRGSPALKQRGSASRAIAQERCAQAASGRAAIVSARKMDLDWSGRRDSNSRPQPWQGCALPLSYARTPRRGRTAVRLVERRAYSGLAADCARALSPLHSRMRKALNALKQCATASRASAPIKDHLGARRMAPSRRMHSPLM